MPEKVVMRWEYHTEKFPVHFQLMQGVTFDETAMARRLNELGQDGWELVSVFSIPARRVRLRAIHAVLKRPVT